ncbi:MAG: ORF6N domain-containing protein [Clostridiales bacterium]|nr:ORF6N domain-containing protein [Clostridiales bacterium]
MEVSSAIEVKKFDLELTAIHSGCGFISAFNQQVKRNVKRFDEDFKFELNKEEMEVLSKSQIVISMDTKKR